MIGADDCTRAAVTTNGRGYFVWLYTVGDDPSLNAPYDGAWFEEVLATLRLQPEDAVDPAPSSSPWPIVRRRSRTPERFPAID